MARTDGISVSLENLSRGCWTKLREFENEHTIKPSRSSSYNSSQGVCSTIGPFRVRVDADPLALPTCRANGLRIRLNFDLGDQLNNYETFVLYRRHESLVDLSETCALPTMSLKAGRLTHCVENVTAPFNDPADECWYRASFEFKRLRQGEFVGQSTKNVSEHQGRVRVDVSHVEILPSRLRDIPIDPLAKIKRTDQSVLRGKGITLEARLKFDLDQPIKPQIKFKCFETAGSRQHNFIFLYREKGHCEEILSNQLEVVVARSLLTPSKPQQTFLEHHNTSSAHHSRPVPADDHRDSVSSSLNSYRDTLSGVSDGGRENLSYPSLLQVEPPREDSQLSSIRADLLLLQRDSEAGEQAKLRAQGQLQKLIQEQDIAQVRVQRCEQKLSKLRLTLARLSRDRCDLESCIETFNADEPVNTETIYRIFDNVRKQLLEMHNTNQSKLKELDTRTKKRKRAGLHVESNDEES